jgi:predicted P-loop ATPase/GTPase
MSFQKSIILESIDKIQNYKNASKLPHQIVEIDKLSNKDIMKIFYRILPSQILKIGPFYIFYLLKDVDTVLWKAMLEYIRIFYNQTCREKISTAYKKNFEDANLMVLCISQDQEIYTKYKMDLLNGFLIANL